MFLWESKIVGKKKVADRVWEIEIAKPADFLFEAGQYIWLVLPNLLANDPSGDRRAFSISSSPKNSVVSVLFHESDSNYKKTLLSLENDAPVELIGPLGDSFVLKKESEKQVVMFAGGVGMAPFLSILRSLKPSDGHSPMKLICANSSAESLPCADELSKICSEMNIPFTNHLGPFRENILPTNINYAADTFLICGPQGFVDVVSQTLNAKGTSFEQMRFEQNFPIIPQNLTEEDLKIKVGENNIMLQAVSDSRNHVIVTDANGKIIFANKTAQTVTGFTFDEMRGNTPRLWGGLMPKDFYRSFWQKITKEGGFEGEINNRRKSGETYTAFTHISPIYGLAKNIIGYIGTEEDISRAKEVDRMKTEFISLASHQLRFLLNLFRTRFADD